MTTISKAAYESIAAHLDSLYDKMLHIESVKAILRAHTEKERTPNEQPD